MNKDIVFLGIQWCGKWTQAKLLLQKLPDFLYLEMGQTLRAITSNTNLIWDYIKDVINNGKMVDNYITYDIIETSLKIAHHNQKNIMIDGFPRMPEQAEFFANTMKSMNRDYVVVYLELSKEKALERMMHRAGIEGRKDDNPQAMNNRLDIFFHDTMQVIKHFEEMWKVIAVNADDTIENISKDLMEKLGLS